MGSERFENGTTTEVANEMVLTTDGWKTFYPEILRLARDYYEWSARFPMPLSVPKRLSSNAASIQWLENNAAALCMEVQLNLKRVPRDYIPKIEEEDLLQWRRWLLWRILMAKQENEI